jgi:carbon-monoxide dehydrogenase medium subunit
MYASSFSYHRAGSVAEARSLLGANPGAKILAGGHSLIPLLKLRLAAPSAVVDIGRVAELKGISVAGGALRIGALTTHAELAASAAVRERCPLLAEAAGQVGDPAVRNRGTIGGNVAHADPASDLPTVLVAAGARLTAMGRAGERTMAASDFFTGMMATALGEDEVLTAIEVPARQAGQGMAYSKFAHPATRYAVIGVAAIVTVAGGTCTGASVAVGGLVPKPARLGAVEQALGGQKVSPDVIAAAATRTGDGLGGDLLGDLYASADYRRAVAPVWVRRALTLAAERAAR